MLCYPGKPSGPKWFLWCNPQEGFLVYMLGQAEGCRARPGIVAELPPVHSSSSCGCCSDLGSLVWSDQADDSRSTWGSPVLSGLRLNPWGQGSPGLAGCGHWLLWHGCGWTDYRGSCRTGRWWQSSVSQGEGLIGCLGLVYGVNHGIPRLQVFIRGSSWSHHCHRVLDVGVEPSPELDYYGFGVGVPRVGYDILEFVYVVI